MSLILGHRGASGYAPENTLEAFKLALDMGADGIELDVQLTSDHVLVVCHDEKVDRTSNGKGQIRDFMFDEIRKLNFNYNHPEYAYCQIPTLEEVLQLFQNTGKLINIELKTGIYPYPGIEQMVVDLVHQYKMEDQIIYSSFNHHTIKRVLQCDPNAYCGFLDEDWIINYGAYAKANGAKAVHPSGYVLQDMELVKEVIANGIDINTWTINEEKDIAMCLKYNLHGIITNYPDRGIALRKQLQGK